MQPSRPPPADLAAAASRLQRYAAWTERRRAAILLAGAAVLVAGAALAAGLPLRTDLSNLLPPEARSVHDLEEIERRTSVLGLALAAVASDDPALRARGATALAARIGKLDPSLVANVVADDGPARRFAWDNRYLFASVGDLEDAREALAARVRRAKLKVNPLFVSLDDDEAPAGARRDDERIEKLRRQLDEAERRARQPSGIVSADGKVQLIIVQAAFPSAAVERGDRLVAALEAAAAETERELGPGLSIGVTEDVVIAAAEHRAILRGMALAAILTVLVVAASLLLFYRSLAAVAALLGALAVGTVATFGLTRLVIGHLNSVTAFLSSIVVGNGINFGIIVVARHLEERRAGAPASVALAHAVAGSFTGTLAAALAAGVAYGSLLVTDFRGFRHFGIIGGTGMVLCWTAAYTVLPALLAALERAGLIRVRARVAARLSRRVTGGQPRRVVAAGAVVALVATGLTARYLWRDPFEYDWQRMRSSSAEARRARGWMQRIDDAFGRQLVGGFIVATGSETEAAAVERTLTALAEDAPGAQVPPDRALFRAIGSLPAMLPRDQPEKLRVLAEIRRLLADPALDALADDAQLAEVRRLRPPADLRALALDDVPPVLASRFVERDGRRGRLLVANQASRFDGWNGRHMIAFARAVRELELPPGTAMGGGAFVFADILDAVTRAGPRATLVALLGVVGFVLLVVGRGRHAAVTLACLVVGTVAMTAIAALAGMKVNFLDFVALPITLGIGVDYAVNVVARARAGADTSGLGGTRAAVVLCSWTTTVGYASLLLSGNAGIESFGLTAMIGEVTCLLGAVTLAPALLAVLERRERSPG